MSSQGTQGLEDEVVFSKQEKRKIANRKYSQSDKGKETNKIVLQRYFTNHPEIRENWHALHKESNNICTKNYYNAHREEVCAKARERYHAKKALLAQ